MKTRAMMILLLALLTLTSQALAREVAGVSLREKATVGGQSLILNGAGLREKLFIDVYVGALYLPKKTTRSKEAIESDVPKRIEMVFLRDVDKEKLADTLEQNLAKAKSAALDAKAKRLTALMDDAREGDRVYLDYVPGEGISVSIKGRKKGTIEGFDFMKAVFAIYIGDEPSSEQLKKGMLGK
ncbi:chalcone isomerase family protein [Myxococcota bacterium]|nr:chalcone isomerase family protein [Myxococcota bacterium]MBU1431484.1 chalcone isomerase family protein [Myxococcota bacterium]MBU1898253.1 chalcone isomerase family protein [Myxococcota bacterium]